MSDNYTPSRIEVLCRYQEWAGGSSSDTVREAEFDRFLAAYRASVLEEAAEAVSSEDRAWVDMHRGTLVRKLDAMTAIRALKEPG